MSTLIITHSGQEIKKMEIVIPGFRSLPFFERVTAKEKFLADKLAQFKLENVTLLIKLMNDYEIYLRL